MIIYALKNNRTGEIYVGQTRNINTRFIAHKTKLKRNKHSSCLNKWKVEDISIEILEMDVPNNISFKREQFWIDKLNAVNIRMADGKHTEKSRKIYAKTWHRPKPEHVKAAASIALKKAWKENRIKMLKANQFQRKLTRVQVIQIRCKIQKESNILNGKRFRKNGLRFSKIGKKYGVSAATICLIAKG